MRSFFKLNIGAEQYPALTGIRALGAFAVFYDHFTPYSGLHIVINVLSFFFVLSGFLIIHLYYTERSLDKKWFLKYFTNRFARIYPVYFLLVTIAIYLSHNYSATVLIKNYTLTHAFFNNYKEILIQPSWSITVEECFYISAPLIIYLTARYNLLVPLIITIATTIVALFVSYLNTSFLHTPLFLFSTTYFGYFIDFFAGAYIALVVRKQYKRGKDKVDGVKWTLAGALLTISTAGIISYIYSIPPLNYTVMLLLNNAVLPIPIAILYYGIIMEQSVLRRLLSVKLLGFFGRTSYSFYLVHALIIDYLAIPYLSKYIPDKTQLILVTFLITLIASAVLYIFYEEPLNKGIRKLLKPGKGKLATT